MTEPLATLESLKDMLGVEGTHDDQILSHSLQSAHHWICSRVWDDHILHPDVQQAELLLAARLYKRRQSPEGVAGMNEFGVVRISREDWDIKNLLALHLDPFEKTFGLA